MFYAFCFWKILGYCYQMLMYLKHLVPVGRDDLVTESKNIIFLTFWFSQENNKTQIFISIFGNQCLDICEFTAVCMLSFIIHEGFSLLNVL